VADNKRGLTQQQKGEILKRYDPDISMLNWGKMYGVSKQAISQLLKRNGVRVEGVVRCDECDTNHYARGYCRRHYRRWRRRNRGAVGPQVLKPIGCPECRTKPYAKGLCKNCRRRQLRRQSNL